VHDWAEVRELRHWRRELTTGAEDGYEIDTNNWFFSAGEEKSEELYPWGYYRAVDSLFHLGMRRKKRFLRNRYAHFFILTRF
jgi:hypothetical protein